MSKRQRQIEARARRNRDALRRAGGKQTEAPVQHYEEVIKLLAQATPGARQLFQEVTEPDHVIVMAHADSDAGRVLVQSYQGPKPGNDIPDTVIIVAIPRLTALQLFEDFPVVSACLSEPCEPGKFTIIVNWGDLARAQFHPIIGATEFPATDKEE